MFLLPRLALRTGALARNPIAYARLHLSRGDHRVLSTAQETLDQGAKMKSSVEAERRPKMSYPAYRGYGVGRRPFRLGIIFRTMYLFCAFCMKSNAH